MIHPSLEMMRVMVAFLASTAALLSGYDIMKRTKLSKGTSYQAAYRLTDEGWLTRKTERSNPNFGMPPRTLYQVTPKGAEQAQAVLALLKVST